MNSIRYIELFDDYTDWTLIDDATEVVAASTLGLVDTNSVSFNKVDGTNHTFGGMYKTIGSTDKLYPHDAFWQGDFDISDNIGLCFYVGAITNVAQAAVRIGTSVSHYVEWKFHDTQMQASSWNTIVAPIGQCSVTGNGADLSKIRYMQVGIEFDAESNALTGIIMHKVFLQKAVRTILSPVMA